MDLQANLRLTSVLFDNFNGANNVFSPAAIMFMLGVIQVGSTGAIAEKLNVMLGRRYNILDLHFLRKSLNYDPLSTMDILVYRQIDREYLTKIESLVIALSDRLNVNEAINVVTDGTMSVPLANSLTNYIKIICIWRYAFDPAETMKATFHLTQLDQVEMMHQINMFDYFQNDLIQLVELPLADPELRYGVILPRTIDPETSIYSMNNIPKISVDDVVEHTNHLEQRLINLYLPKYTHEKNIDLKSLLDKVGLNEIKAYDALKHNAMVIVDETGVEFAEAPPGEPDILFNANRVFIYYVRHVSGVFLFYGDFQGVSTSSRILNISLHVQYSSIY